MALQRLLIKDFLEKSKGSLILDVRSPGEYLHAHLPGAINLPLFNDEERKVVGTAYKQVSREEAIRIGLDYFGPKMRTMVELVDTWMGGSKTAAQDKPLFVYCWRGGMRSGAVAWLLDLYGYRVHVLAGGYKSYRNHVLLSFTKSYPFVVVGGYTGSGKTEVLRELATMGEFVIDLEAIASHKGSAFGKYGMPPQPTQEMFENILSLYLEAAAARATPQVWVEDESQRIGDVNIPMAIWQNMRQSPLLFLDIPFEERLGHIAEEYGNYPKEKLCDSIERISKRLGPQHAKTAIQLVEEGNIKEAFRILLLYYDKRYLKGLHNREDLSALLTTVACDTVSNQNAALLSKYQPV